MVMDVSDQTVGGGNQVRDQRAAAGFRITRIVVLKLFPVRHGLGLDAARPVVGVGEDRGGAQRQAEHLAFIVKGVVFLFAVGINDVRQAAFGVVFVADRA